MTIARSIVASVLMLAILSGCLRVPLRLDAQRYCATSAAMWASTDADGVSRWLTQRESEARCLRGEMLQGAAPQRSVFPNSLDLRRN